jgi:hypothetical protein
MIQNFLRDWKMKLKRRKQDHLHGTKLAHGKIND